MFEDLDNELKKLTKYSQKYDKANPPVKKWVDPVVYYVSKLDSKRQYYVQFKYWSPEQGNFLTFRKMKGINKKHDDNKARARTAENLRQAFENVLKKGWVPKKLRDQYVDNYTSLSLSEKTTIISAMDQVYKSMKSKDRYRLKRCIDWLNKHGYSHTPVKSVKRKDVEPFINSYLKVVSGQQTGHVNRNNYRAALHYAWGVFISEGLCEVNIIKGIKKLKSIPNQYQKFSTGDLEKIHKNLQVLDPQLHTFVKLIQYQFMRPIEIVRLKCGDIDLDSKIITYIQQKGQKYTRKTKRIPELLINDLSEYDLSNKDYSVFTSKGIANHEVDPENNRSYWQKRFKRTVKDFLILESGQGLYSIRHNGVTNLMLNLKEAGHDYFTAENKAMVYTGHETVESFRKYLRNLAVWLPDDYSELIK